MPTAKPRNAIPLSTVVVDQDALPGSEAVASLAASIAEVGLINPISVTPDGRLLAGRHRYVACRSLGWKKIPATVVDLDAVPEVVVVTPTP